MISILVHNSEIILWIILSSFPIQSPLKQLLFHHKRCLSLVFPKLINYHPLKNWKCTIETISYSIRCVAVQQILKAPKQIVKQKTLNFTSIIISLPSIILKFQEHIYFVPICGILIVTLKNTLKLNLKKFILEM